MQARLAFARTGGALACADEDGITVLAGPSRKRIALAGARAIAMAGDQLWIAAPGRLVRSTLGGRILDERALEATAIAAAPVGPAAALVLGDAPQLLVDDLGTLATIAAEPDALAPIAGRRYVRGARDRVVLPSGAAVALLPGSRILGATVVLEGTAVAVIAERGSDREAIVIGLSSGKVIQTAPLPAGALVVAPRRATAMVREAPDRLALVDLRFGRPLGQLPLDPSVVEIAIDPDGLTLAARTASGEVAVHAVAQLAAAALAPARTGALSSASITVAPIAPAAPAPLRVKPRASEPPRATWDGLDVAMLQPRAWRARASRCEALAELDRELRCVTLWTLGAIARAWDTRRLGYGNEGAHPYEHEVAALVGMNGGFARDYVESAADALADHERALSACASYRSAAMPLGELADEFGLSADALEILLVVAAPAISGEVARLYGILANDAARAPVDPQLVEQVLAGRVERHDIASELHPRAPLLALGIIEARPGRGRPFVALEVDPVILARLRGELPDLGAAPIARTADRTLADLELPPSVAQQLTAALRAAKRPLRLAVRGRAGTGRRTLLAAVGQLAHRTLGLIDAAVLPRDAERFQRALSVAVRRAHLAGMLPVVHGLEAIVFGDRDGHTLAHEALAAHPGPLAVISPPGTTPPFPVGHAVVDIPPPNESERAATWTRALAATPCWLRDPAGIAARYRVGAGVIHRAVASLDGHDAAQPADDHLDAFLRQIRDVRLADHARRVDRLASWSDLVLPSDIMDSLRELIGRVRHRRTVFEDWGMSRTMSTSRGLTALFQGQPGTGKTLVAGVIARELGLDLYQVDLSKVMSKWIGETERNLSAIFDAAEDGQVILLFDEADSLFAKRTEVRSSNDRYANLEVNYLLQRLDAFEGIAILTTNSGGSIDPAFKRRLSFRLSFPFPDEDTRAELWRSHLPAEIPRAGELVFDALARKYQISGGYIRNACLRAAFLAAQEETALAQHHLERAVALEFAELGKLSTGGTID
ncbi:MAG: ATP-binding protein [Myxococcales bacterium]|nr:ATP-binding protein [Myxococcales bacterium]